MNRTLALLSLAACLAQTQPLSAAEEPPIDLQIGGAGGVYFLASPGELVVEVEKRDRNRTGRKTRLQAILVGPDRRVLQVETIPEDGQPRGSGVGPPGRVRLATQVLRKGVYGLNVTVSQDRYGDDIAWGFRTNCPKYLIETARGHRDERRQEPIVLLNPGASGDVCFLPRAGAFGMEITGIPSADPAPVVYDAKDQRIHTFDVGTDGRASHTFAADVHREAVPWRLHLPVQQATVHIDGVTRWDPGDLYTNLPYWTPDRKSFFPFQSYRWLLTPYRQIVYGQPGTGGKIAFSVHNNSDRRKTVRLEIEFPDDPWPAELSSREVVLEAKKSAQVTVAYTVPAEGQTRQVHVRATPAEDPDFSTYSTLVVRAGVAPAAAPLDMPLLLKAYEHENGQFGYLPDYPVDNQVYFDLKNRPAVIASPGVATLEDGRWTTYPTRTAEDKSYGASLTKIAFDGDDDMYVLGRSGREIAMLRSTDRGKAFAACVIPGREDRGRSFDIEQFSGHNLPDGPPPIVRNTHTASDPKLRWRRINDLELFVPEKVDGRLAMGEPVLLSRKCIGLSAHSGIPSTVVSRGDKVHVAWAEATDPAEKVPGVPTYVATYDRRTKTLGKPALVGYGAPPNDVHNSPSITIDSQGYLHVVIGTHGQPFEYARSLEPNDAGSGWTEPVPVGEGSRQTYIGLVCGADDTLHLVFRLWRSNEEPHPHSHHATLAYQRKPPGKPWEPPRVLVVAPFSEYSIFYHRLTVDRSGRLFLSYDYWSTHWFYRTDHWGTRRALMSSPDGGNTWRLVGAADFQ